MVDRTYTGAKPRTTLPPGAVDTQLHLYLPGFPCRPGGPALPEGLPGPAEYRKVMDWLGVDRLVVTQGNAHQRNNANLLAALDAMGDIARGVAVIDAGTSDTELSEMHARGVRGARIMDLPGGAVGLDALEAVDARAASAGWMMAIQFDGSNIEDHFPRLSRLRSRWVLDHHGKFFRGAAPDGPEVDLVKRLIDGGNSWFKFAGCYESSRAGAPDFDDVAAVARVLACHAPERIVWGTNFPHNLAQSTGEYPDDAALLDTSLSWFPDERGRHLALVENPEALFDFPSFSRSAAI
ncbi:amidohydrolase family protein [Tranquillimonas alkanivorans]|uniref:D-galactarolactone isomerase n=1 Tax=Tranquillimonas alkanivorans TaxID=441119 RepID=A0A1I5Q1J6_9RHOB|nr:amidohydrolase family protein [Tranquillimonas alkanivorans]SFP40208.1 D-galactarolactone isomerase [Tranquillimonas alkanivorans]